MEQNQTNNQIGLSIYGTYGGYNNFLLHNADSAILKSFKDINGYFNFSIEKYLYAIHIENGKKIFTIYRTARDHVKRTGFYAVSLIINEGLDFEQDIIDALNQLADIFKNRYTFQNNINNVINNKVDLAIFTPVLEQLSLKPCVKVSKNSDQTAIIYTSELSEVFEHAKWGSNLEFSSIFVIPREFTYNVKPLAEQQFIKYETLDSFKQKNPRNTAVQTGPDEDPKKNTNDLNFEFSDDSKAPVILTFKVVDKTGKLLPDTEIHFLINGETKKQRSNAKALVVLELQTGDQVQYQSDNKKEEITLQESIDLELVLKTPKTENKDVDKQVVRENNNDNGSKISNKNTGFKENSEQIPTNKTEDDDNLVGFIKKNSKSLIIGAAVIVASVFVFFWIRSSIQESKKEKEIEARFEEVKSEYLQITQEIIEDYSIKDYFDFKISRLKLKDKESNIHAKIYNDPEISKQIEDVEKIFINNSLKFLHNVNSFTQSTDFDISKIDKMLGMMKNIIELDSTLSITADTIFIATSEKIAESKFYELVNKPITGRAYTISELNNRLIIHRKLAETINNFQSVIQSNNRENIIKMRLDVLNLRGSFPNNEFRKIHNPFELPQIQQGKLYIAEKALFDADKTDLNQFSDEIICNAEGCDQSKLEKYYEIDK